MKHLVLCLFILMSSAAQAQSTDLATYCQTEFSQYAEQVRQDWDLPGLAIAVVEDGEIILAQGFGHRDLAASQMVDAHTAFSIASCSKSFTALLLDMQQAAGRLNLNDPVGQYLPGFQMHDPYVSEHVTATDFLMHRTGVPDHELSWYGSPRTRDELIAAMAHFAPSTGFRERWQYNNYGYLVAGKLIETVTEMSWEEAMTEQLFAPLGLAESFATLEAAQSYGNIAAPHSLVDGKQAPIPFMDLKNLAPAGGIYASATDMAKWVLLHLENGAMGDKQVIPPEAMTTNHTPEMIMHSSAHHLSSYAHGWYVEGKNHPMYHHGGGVAGMVCKMGFNPDLGFGFVILTNSDVCWPVRDILERTLVARATGGSTEDWNARYKDIYQGYSQKLAAYHGKIMAQQKPDTTPSLELKDYAGCYRHAGYGEFWVKLEDGKLQAQLNHVRSSLPHFHDDIFHFTNAHLAHVPEFLVTFELDARGQLESLSAQLQGGVDDVVFLKD